MSHPLPSQSVLVARDEVPAFYIPATTSLQERNPRTLKQGEAFAVFDPNGDIVPGRASPEGLFHADTRHLSLCTLTLGGRRPLLLSSSLRADNASLTCDLTNPDLFEDEHLVLERDLIHIRRTKFLWQEGCFERLDIGNFSAEARSLPLELGFAADFADLFEVRGSRRERRGTMHEPRVGTDHLIFYYTGLDDVRRVTCVYFDPTPARVHPHGAVFQLHLSPHSRCTVYVEVGFGEGEANRQLAVRFRSGLRQARRALREAAARMASVDTSNEIFNEIARRTVADISMLVTEKPEGPYPYAGIPWFSAPFGRDALITALQMLWMDPDLARGVLRFLAAHQATHEDAEADAEPGKIVHEMRLGEMASLGEVPFRCYYGSVDATPLFVLLAGAYFERTGDLQTLRALWPHVRAALTWIDRDGDRDGDGFIEYGRRSEQGLANQGWKDSHDSIFHADGSLAVGPIALVEVQAYVYAAKHKAAQVARALGDSQYAAELDRQAESLRNQFESHFWCEELGTYALALDGQKHACRVRSSNAGHALFAGIADPQRARRVAAQLLGDDFFCGWGIRTLARREVRYNPMSYHNGSVWPHDNALIALGFARYGFRAETVRVFDGLFAAATEIDLRRLPELFCGFPRRPGRGPTLYPVACNPQAWAAVAPVALLQACLGLSFDVAGQLVRLEQPILPEWLGEVTVRGIRLGADRVDVRIIRGAGEIAVTTLARIGQLRVASIS